MQPIEPTIFDILLQGSATINLFDVLINVLLAFVLGFFIAAIYRLTYQGYAYSAAFVNTLIIISMVTAIVIMVIGNNLARAFGLVGAMSIIRFRTAVKDSKDIAFVFFALAAGLATGAGSHMIGLVSCILVGAAILFLYLFNFGITPHKELLLRFWMAPSEDEKPPYLRIFEKYFKTHRLINMRSARLGQFLELSFNVRFKDDASHQKLIKELSMIEGIERISLVVGEATDDPSV
jgi:uncharacterized membrane protein YhiD involved in acid resistance